MAWEVMYLVDLKYDGFIKYYGKCTETQVK